jgi:hypothetical protein
VLSPSGAILFCEDDASGDNDTHPLAPGFTNVDWLIGLSRDGVILFVFSGRETTPLALRHASSVPGFDCTQVAAKRSKRVLHSQADEIRAARRLGGAKHQTVALDLAQCMPAFSVIYRARCLLAKGVNIVQRVALETALGVTGEEILQRRMRDARFVEVGHRGRGMCRIARSPASHRLRCSAYPSFRYWRHHDSLTLLSQNGNTRPL